MASISGYLIIIEKAPSDAELRLFPEKEQKFPKPLCVKAPSGDLTYISQFQSR